MVTKVSDVKNLVEKGRANSKVVFPEVKKMAGSDDWKVREVAATIIVEISKKNPDETIKEMEKWAESVDPNIRRTASEGSRDMGRKTPEKIHSVLEKLKMDENLYVKKIRS